MLAVVKRLGKPVSEICHCFEPVPQLLRNVRYKSGQPLADDGVVKAIASAEARLNGQGGLVIRPSGTETVIRVMAEGDNADLVEQVVSDVVDVIARAAA